MSTPRALWRPRRSSVGVQPKEREDSSIDSPHVHRESLERFISLWSAVRDRTGCSTSVSSTNCLKANARTRRPYGFSSVLRWRHTDSPIFKLASSQNLIHTPHRCLALPRPTQLEPHLPSTLRYPEDPTGSQTCDSLALPGEIRRRAAWPLLGSPEEGIEAVDYWVR